MPIDAVIIWLDPVNYGRGTLWIIEVVVIIAIYVGMDVSVVVCFTYMSCCTFIGF